MTRQVPGAMRCASRSRRRRATGRIGALALVAPLLGLGLVVGPAPTATATVTGPCGNGNESSTDTVTTCTYGSTGSEDTFTVPAGVTSVHVIAVGGSGGQWAFNYFGQSGFTLKSLGAVVTSDLTVTPGATLYVEVAGNGASTYYPAGETFGDGGFNGGGDGGKGNGGCLYGCRDRPAWSGAGGGGASDVRTSPRSAGLTTDSRLLVAAGGGGAGANSGTGGFTGYTGGGGDAGSAGADGYTGPGYGGGAGTLTAGGTGGAGLGVFYAQDGTDGVLGSGGVGGGGDADSQYDGGGGGGGGLYGGGGGGSHKSPGGGGGGFSYSSGTDTTFGLGTAGGAPSIVISFDIPAPQSPVVSSADHATFPAGSAGSFTVTTTAGIPTATTITESGILPPGVTFTDNGDGTATLAGTPTVTGAFPITITAGNGQSTDASQSFTLTVTQPPTISSAAEATFSIAGTNSFTVTTTAGHPTATTLSASGTLPSGVAFIDNGDGTATLAGTPVNGSSGSYPLTVTAANDAGPSDQSFTLTVTTIPPDTSIDSGPAVDSTISTTTATFIFSGIAADTLTLQCSLDGSAFTDCTSPHTFSELGNGSHTAAFRAVDDIGKADPSPAQRTFTVDVADVVVPPAAAAPVNAFTLPATGRAHTAKGTLTLRVRLPGAGVLRLKTAGRSPVRAAKVTLLRGGLAKITVKPTRAGLKRLEHSSKGRMRVNVAFTFTPTGGSPNTRTKVYRLVLR